MRVLFLRHGLTEGNLHRRYIGSTDEPLSSEGIAQFAEKKLRTVVSVEEFGEPFRVFVSPMQRCLQSAALFLGTDERLTVAEDLRECDFGRFENKNYQELDKDAEYQDWIDSGGTLPFPGGESKEIFQERCCRCFARLMSGPPEAEGKKALPALFVVHGGTIMSILDRWGKDEDQAERSYYDWHVENACGYLTELTPGGEHGMTLHVIRKI